jgi:hypothetical protein
MSDTAKGWCEDTEKIINIINLSSYQIQFPPNYHLAFYNFCHFSVAISYLEDVEFFAQPVCRIDDHHASVSSHRTLCCDSSPFLASSYTQHTAHSTQHTSTQSMQILE